MRYYASHANGNRTRSAIRAAGLGMLGSAAHGWKDSEWRPLVGGGARVGGGQRRVVSLPGGRSFRRQPLSSSGAQVRRSRLYRVPDVVMDWPGTLAMRRRWLDWLLTETPHRVLLPVQNGATNAEVRPILGQRVGVFVGGDTAWKLHTMRSWADTAHSVGAYCHVGRVNTATRVRLCRDAGVDSVDGSGPARFSDTAALVAAGLTGPLQAGLPFTF